MVPPPADVLTEVRRALEQCTPVAARVGPPRLARGHLLDGVRYVPCDAVAVSDAQLHGWLEGICILDLDRLAERRRLQGPNLIGTLPGHRCRRGLQRLLDLDLHR